MSGVRLSLLLVPDGDPDALRRTAASVLAQDWPAWELLCLDPAPAGGADPVADLVADARVRRLGTGRPTVAGALNVGLEHAVGTHVAVLDAGDELAPSALREVVATLACDATPRRRVVVTDESQAGGEGGHNFHKPVWSPEYLRGHCWTGRLSVVELGLLVELGGFREDLDGAHEWDLVLRAVERTGGVSRVRTVLCRRRAAASSGLGDRPAAQGAALRAVDAHLARCGLDGHAEAAGAPGYVHVRRHLGEEPLVSVVVPTGGGTREVGGETVDLVTRALRSVRERTDWPAWEVVLVVAGAVDPQGTVERATKALDGADRLRVVHVDGPFNFARSVNLGVHAAAGSVIALLNDDVEVREPGWLRRMTEMAVDPDVGAVGALLLFDDGRVQHGGVFGQLNGLPYHAHMFEADSPGYRGSLRVASEQLAVTGACLVVRRETFLDVGGMSERFPLNFNDVDLCLKLLVAGYRNVLVPEARLVHSESSTRQARLAPGEVGLLQQRWGAFLETDPYFSRDRLAGFGG